MRVDDDVRLALTASHLGELSAELLDELLIDAVRVAIPPGAVLHPEGESAPHLELVVSGVVRVYVGAPDGRTMTVRYCRPGALIGVASLFAPGFALPAAVQALTHSEVLRMSTLLVRRASEREVRVARALLGEQSERAMSFLFEVPGGAFGTVRQRVARHLLDLASEDARGSGPDGGALVVRVSQQALSEAVGTAREVVVRVLRQLREAGIVRTGRDGIVLVDPGRLAAEQGWNQSS